MKYKVGETYFLKETGQKVTITCVTQDNLFFHIEGDPKGIDSSLNISKDYGPFYQNPKDYLTKTYQIKLL